MTTVLQSLAVGAGEGQRRGPLLTIDPRLRILTVGIFALVTVSMVSLPALCGALVLALVAMVAAWMPLGPTLRRMLVMDGFLVVMVLLLPFTTSGTPLFHLAGFPASAEGLHLAITILLKANAVILMLMAMVGTMEPVTLGHALARLRVPERLVHLLLFTVRYLDVIQGEVQRLRRAMAVRGFLPGTNAHTWRTYGYLIGMVLVRALERSERILAAMRCRGFTGQLVLMDRLRYRPVDAVFAVGAVSALLALVVADFWLRMEAGSGPFA